MDLKHLILIYGFLLSLNFFYCLLLWVKSRAAQYKIQTMAYFFFSLTLTLQAVSAQQSAFLRVLAASTVFAGLSAFTKLISLITKCEFPLKKFALVYVGGVLLTGALQFLSVDENWMTLPCLLGAVYPLLSTALLLLREKSAELTFSTKCFLVTSILYCGHMLDYAYAVDKPQWAVLGFSFAVICILGIIMFSNAAVMESTLIENTRIKLQIQYKAMLTNSSKLASLGEMAGGVAHEINNPLTIIQLHSDNMKRHVLKGELEQDLALRRIEAITQSVARIGRVINNLRYFSRDSSQDPITEASVESVVEQTLTFCKVRFLEKGVEIVSGDIPPIVCLCRPAQLSQALLNLLNNSFEAVVREAGTNKFIRLDARLHERQVEIRVRDSGPGVPESFREKIFDPFFTTKDIGQGMGLGLSVSMGMIQSQNGRLYLDTSSQETCFVIELPAVLSGRS